MTLYILKFRHERHVCQTMRLASKNTSLHNKIQADNSLEICIVKT